MYNVGTLADIPVWLKQVVFSGEINFCDARLRPSHIWWNRLMSLLAPFPIIYKNTKSFKIFIWALVLCCSLLLLNTWNTQRTSSTYGSCFQQASKLHKASYKTLKLIWEAFSSVLRIKPYRALHLCAAACVSVRSPCITCWWRMVHAASGRLPSHSQGWFYKNPHHNILLVGN